MFRLYWETAGRHRRLYLRCALGLFVVDMLDLLPPLFIGWLIDTVSGADTGFTPLTIAALFMGVVVLQNVFRYPMRMYSIGTSRRVTADLRDRYIRHLAGMSQTFYMRNATGDLMSRAS
ncbi:MAG: ABC transporter transmembrane domain-containing protein, partial [Planctomycetota bacterium]